MPPIEVCYYRMG